jgi:hypothetical protein
MKRGAGKESTSLGEPRAWLGVVSRTHVQRGVAEGFAQVCHGRAAPLSRMRPGDYLVYYSPSIEMGGAPLRAFTAIGRVQDADVFQFDMGGGFVPYRRRVAYEPRLREVALSTLKERLELCAAPNWGMLLRRGHLPLSQHDFRLIAAAMGSSSARSGSCAA